MNSKNQTLTLIQSFDELIAALCEEDPDSYGDIMHSLDIPMSEFQKHSTWSNDSYTRNCIFQNEKFELILLCWEEGQITPIHNHGGEECWVRIIQGEFKESIYKEGDEGALELIRVATAKRNDLTYMVDFMGTHSLANLSKKRSMSLHLYAKPIRECEIFDEESNKFVNKKMVYDTICKRDYSL